MHNLGKTRTGIFLVGAVLALASLLVVFVPNYRQPASAVNNTINFQARLMTAQGALVPDGNYHIEFKLYNASSSSGSSQGSCSGDANCLWVETRSTGNLVTVKNGYITVNLGSVTSLPSIDWSQDLWVSMRVGGNSGAASWDPEMSPRLKITAVPYAFSTDTLDGIDSTGFVQITPASVQGANSANTAIRLNQTGAGDLLQLQGNGADKLTLTKTGNLTVVGTGTFQGASITIGTSSQLGSVVVYDGSSNTATIQPASLGQNTVYTLPDPGGASDTICLLTLANCGSAGLTLQQVYGYSNPATITLNSTNGGILIRDNATPIGGNLFAVQSDSGTTTYLDVTASAIDLLRNTTVGSGNTFTVAGGATSLTGATSGDALTVSNSTSTGNVAVFKDNSTAVLTIADGGGVTLQNSTNSTAGVAIKNSGGGTIFRSDTSGNNTYINQANSGELGSAWQTNSNTLPSGTTYFPTIAANGYIYTFGGLGAASSIFYARVNADGSTGSWSTASMPAQRRMEGGVILNGFVYLLVGNDNSGNAVNSYYYAKLNSDGSIGSWTLGSTTVATNIQYVKSFTANGYVYIVGGLAPTAVNTVYYARQNPDGSLGTWGTTSTLPGNQASVGLAVGGGYVYTVGGSNSPAAVYYARINSDGTLAAWSTAANSLPANKDSFPGAVYANGYLYVIGGHTSGAPTNTVYYSKIGTSGAPGSWSTSTNTLPANRDGPGTVMLNGYIYAIGGNDGTNNTTTVYYASVNRTQITGALDLLGGTSGVIDLVNNSGAGELVAGNTTISGNLQVSDNVSLLNGLSVNGNLTQRGSAFLQNQVAGSTAFTIQGASSQSGDLVQITNSSGSALSGFDSSGQLYLGRASGLTGSSKFFNSSGSGSITVDANNPGSTAYTLHLPAENGTLCSTGSICSGYAAASGSGAYVQLAPGSAQTDSSTNNAIDISHTGAGGSLGNFDATNSSANGVSIDIQSNSSSQYALNVSSNNGNYTGLYVRGDGNVGVGSSSPQGALFVATNSLNQSSPTLILQNSGLATGYTQMRYIGTGRTFQSGVGNASETTFGVADKYFIYDSTGNAMRLVIDTSGNVGINTASPGAKFDVLGATTGTALNVSNNTSTGAIATFKDNSTTVATIADGGATNFQNSTNSSNAFKIQNANGNPLFNVDTSISTNLVTNGDFENGTTGWALKGTATISQTTSHQQQGYAALDVSTAAAANDGATFNLTLSSTTQYTLSFWAKVSANAGSNLSYGYAQDGSTETGSTTSLSQTTTTTWRKYSFTFTTGTVSGTPYLFFKQTNSNARHIYIDGVQVQTGATASAFSPNGAMQINGYLNSPLSIQNMQDTTHAFDVNNASGTNIFAVDTVGSQAVLNGTLRIGDGTGITFVNGANTGSLSITPGAGLLWSPSNNATTGLELSGSRANLLIDGLASNYTPITIKGNNSQSVNLLSVQTSGGLDLGGFDSAGQLFVGRASGLTGYAKFYNASGSGSISVDANNPSSTAYTLHLPAENGTICSTGSVCSGYQASGSYANTALSNLASVAINTALLPGADNTIDLGSAAASFSTLYADTSVLTPSVDTQTAAALGIGTGTQNALTVGRSGASTTINGSAASVIDFGNFDVSAAGVITLAGAQTADITTQSNNALTLTPGGTGQLVLNSSNTSASAVDINATGTVAGAAITLDTTNGGIALTAAGASNGDISLNATDDITIDGTAGSLLNIGTSSVAQTITIGASSNTDLALQDANWSVTGAGAATFASLTNNGFTYNNTLALSDDNNGGVLGTNAASSVDIYTSISLAQTTASQTFTLASPTASTNYGRIIYISNIGTTSFSLYGQTVAAGSTVTLVWSNTNGGASWQYTGQATGSYANTSLSNLSSVAINTALLPNADNTIDLGSAAASFRTLYADTSVLTPSVDTQVAAALGIGTGTQNALTVGRSGASTTINGSSASVIDFGNFDVSAAGVITLAGAQTADITTQSNNALTLTPGGTGQLVLNSSNTSASAVDINATGTVAGNAITLDTTNGGIALTAAGASNGDITLAATDDISINGTAGSLLNIGTSNVTQTITIGNSSNTDLVLQDANWSVTGAGAASFVTANTTSGYYYGGTGSPMNLELTRTIPTTVNDYVEIGNFNLSNGAHNFRVSISNSDSTTFSISKQYMLTIYYNATNNTWKAVTPMYDARAGFANDYDLDLNVNNAVANLRLRRSVGTAAGTASIRIESVGSTSDSFTATATTGSTSAPTAFYGNIYQDIASGNTTIGNPGGGTITVGAASGTDLVLQDADWGVTGAGVATFTSVKAPTYDTATGVAMNIGTATQTGLTVGRSGAATTINGSSASIIDFGNFDVSAAGVITLAGAQASDITTQSNNSLTLKPGGTGQFIINSSNTSASAVDINALGTVAGNAITIDTSDGGIALTAAGASNGDITLAATDDIAINGTAGSLVNIGTSSVSQTITIGASSNTDLALQDANWSVTGAGAATLTSLTVSGNVAYQKGTDFSTTGQSDDVNFGNGALIRLTGASAQTITGIAGGVNGRILTIVNAASQAAVISNQSGSSAAANQIVTGTGVDISLTAGGAVTLVYDSGASFWRVSGAAAVLNGSFANTSLSNLSGVAINTALLPNADNTIDLGSAAASFRTLYADTSVLAPSVDTQVAAALGIGTGTQNALTVGRAGASTTINGSSSSVIDFGNFDVSAAGVITLAGAQTSDITTQSNNALTLKPGGTGQFVINSSNASASAVDINATGTVAGNAITLDTTDGGIAFTASGASNGDITLAATDDINVNGTAGTGAGGCVGDSRWIVQRHAIGNVRPIDGVGSNFAGGDTRGRATNHISEGGGTSAGDVPVGILEDEVRISQGANGNSLSNGRRADVNQ